MCNNTKNSNNKLSADFLSAPLEPYTNRNLQAVKVQTLTRTERLAIRRRQAGELALYVNSAVQPQELRNKKANYIAANRKKIYALRTAIGDKLKRVKPCGRYLIDKNESVTVNRGAGSVAFAGLQHCNSVWLCPVCSAKIARHRADEIKDMLTNALDQGNKAVFITLTLPHTPADKLSTLQKTVSNAWRSLTSDVRYKGQYRTKNKVSYLASPGLKQQYGVQGFVRALEVKFGSAGWHPHLHIVLVLESAPVTLVDGQEISTHISAFSEALIALWGEKLSSMYGREIKRPAQDYTEIYDVSGIADYASKWDIGKELTQGHIKEDGSGQTPFQLFQEYQETGEERVLNHFLNYAICFEGVKQLTYSKGFKKRFLSDPEAPELTDQEICEQELQQLEAVVVRITKPLFQALYSGGLTAEFLNVCQFEPNHIRDYLDSQFNIRDLAAAHERPLYDLT